MIFCMNFFLICFKDLNTGRNIPTGPEKSIRFKELSALDCPLWRGFFIRVY